jgi:hypothetical protein
MISKIDSVHNLCTIDTPEFPSNRFDFINRNQMKLAIKRVFEVNE